MGQMGHPYSSKIKASVRRRLRVLGATAGKSWGKASMDLSGSYPKTNAGTERPLTISGGTGPKRADRKAGKYARGGRVKKGGHTTNIIVAQPGGGAAAQAPRPVPVPVPVQQPPAAIPPRPVVVAPGAAPAGAPSPVLPAGARPPGMKRGGAVKKADGGFLKDPPGKTYTGFPHSPTTSVDDAVSAQKRGGAVKKARGGSIGSKDNDENAGEEADEEAEEKDKEDDVKNYKKGGATKKAAGGFVGVNTTSKDPALPGGMYHQQGKGYVRGGVIMKAGSGSGLGRLRESKVAAKVPAKTEL